MADEQVDETKQAMAEWRAKHPNLEADEADALTRGYSSLEEMEEVEAAGMSDDEYFGRQTVADIRAKLKGG